MVYMDAWSTPPQDVASPSMLDLYVGDPPRQLLIFSGTAIPGFRTSEDVKRAKVRIRLGPTVSTPAFGWTAQASLASISNENSDFLLATDSATVSVENGLLILNVDLGVQGDSSTVHRISYSVHVLSDPVQSRILGIIRWPKIYGDPTYEVTENGQPMFRVEFGRTIAPPSDPYSFGQTPFVAHGSGSSGPPQEAGDSWLVSYEIVNVPLGQMWEVRPVLRGGMLAGPPSWFDHGAGFQPMPQRVQLSPSNPSASGVDFAMVFSSGPR